MTTVAPATKRCPRCQQTKPLEEFGVCNHGRHRDGRQTYCRVCHRAIVAAWQRAHPERLAARIRRWREQRKAAAAAALIGG